MKIFFGFLYTILSTIRLCLKKNAGITIILVILGIPDKVDIEKNAKSLEKIVLINIYIFLFLSQTLIEALVERIEKKERIFSVSDKLCDKLCEQDIEISLECI